MFQKQIKNSIQPAEQSNKFMYRKPIPSKLTVVTYVLGILSFIILLIPLATMAGMISSLNLFHYSLIFSGVSILLTFILGFGSVNFIRKNVVKLFVLGGIAFVLFLIYLPSNNNIALLNLEKYREAEIIELGKAVEHYHHINNNYPERLKEISSIPSIDNYIYKIENVSGKEYFVIKRKEPHNMIKGMGLAPPKKIKEIIYVQDKGLIVKTE